MGARFVDLEDLDQLIHPCAMSIVVGEKRGILKRFKILN